MLQPLPLITLMFALLALGLAAQGRLRPAAVDLNDFELKVLSILT